MSRNGSIFRNIDWLTVILFLGMVLFGWLNIFAASYNYDQTSIFDISLRSGKQFIWILSALVMGGIILIVSDKVYETFAYVFYAILIIILLITPLLAHNVKGSLSWISLGSISFQPAEFAKVITALAVAKFMGRYEYKVRSWRDWILPFVLIGIPALIIMILQRETGSALVMLAFLLVFYRKGMSGYILWLCAIAITFFILAIRFGQTSVPLGEGNVGILVCGLMLILIELYFIHQNHKNPKYSLIILGSIVLISAIACLLCIWVKVNMNVVSFSIVALLMGYIGYLTIRYRRWNLLLVILFTMLSIGYIQASNFVFQKVLQPHQRTRIEVLLGMRDDPSGAEYNINQARIAIGSGRFFGKGYLQGTQTKLRYVPEQDTDFIFCTIGEEWGFVGSCLVLLIYLGFILRLLVIAERQRNQFSQIYGYSVACIFLFHLVINVGMVLGLLPVIGIPLPFFSYGGSSLLGFTILLFILLKLDAVRLNQLH